MVPRPCHLNYVCPDASRNWYTANTHDARPRSCKFGIETRLRRGTTYPFFAHRQHLYKFVLILNHYPVKKQGKSTHLLCLVNRLVASSTSNLYTPKATSWSHSEGARCRCRRWTNWRYGKLNRFGFRDLFFFFFFFSCDLFNWDSYVISDRQRLLR